MSARRKPKPAAALQRAALHERRQFAAKIRAARAILRWSQAELGERIGLTQRSINRLEQSEVDVRRSTAVAIEIVLRKEGISFEAQPDGGFRIIMAGKGTRRR